MTITSADLNKLKEAGTIAKAQLYRSLILKIRDGNAPTASEAKFLIDFERELDINSDSSKIVSYEDAAAYCGFSKRSLSYHIGKGNIIQEPDGSFLTRVLDDFLINHKKRTKSTPDLKEKKDQADLRYKIAKASKEEILTQQLKSNLFSRDEIAQAWAQRVHELTAGLNTLINRLPTLLEGKSKNEMRVIIKKEIWYFRDSYARQGKYTPKKAVA
jgi:hypothetical protein